MYNALIPPALHDAMLFCSKRLFNASQDGNLDFALATIRATIKTLETSLEEATKVNNHGTH